MMDIQGLPTVSQAKPQTYAIQPTATLVAPKASSILGLHQLGPSFFGSQRLQAVRFGFADAPKDNIFDLEKLKWELVRYRHDPKERLKIGQPLLDALEQYGYIRVKKHGVDRSLVKRVFKKTAEILSKPLDELLPFSTPEISQFRGLQLKLAKNEEPGDPKRVFVVGNQNNVWMKGHERLTNNGIALFNSMQGVSQTMLEVLSLIYEGKTDGLLTRQVFKDSLNTTKPVAETASLRQIYYPNAEQLNSEKATIKYKIGEHFVRLEPHLDYGLITVLPASDKEGLYVLPHSIAKQYNVNSEETAKEIPLTEWIKVESNADEVLIQLGRQMDLATKRMANPISATWHAVLATKNELEVPRTSAALFIENKLDPVFDYQRYIEMNANHLNRPLDERQLVVATYQFPNGRPFPVDCLPRLMFEKWVAEKNPKAYINGDINQGLIPIEKGIHRYMNFAETVAQVIADKPTLLSDRDSTQA